MEGDRPAGTLSHDTKCKIGSYEFPGNYDGCLGTGLGIHVPLQCVDTKGMRVRISVSTPGGEGEGGDQRAPLVAQCKIGPSMLP